MLESTCTTDGAGGAVVVGWNAPTAAAAGPSTTLLLLPSSVFLDRVTFRDTIAMGYTRSVGAGASLVGNGFGGALAVAGTSSRAIVTRSLFSGCEAWGSPDARGYTAGDWGEGGAVHISAGAVANFSNTIFEGSVAEKEGGSAVLRGAGTAASFVNCAFRRATLRASSSPQDAHTVSQLQEKSLCDRPPRPLPQRRLLMMSPRFAGRRWCLTLHRDSSVRDDFWDGGGAVIVADASNAFFRLTRFDNCRVMLYPDRRRQCV